MSDLTIDPATTALVLIDLQRGITGGQTVPNAAADVIARAARLAAACRKGGVLVVLVRVDPGANGTMKAARLQIAEKRRRSSKWVPMLKEFFQSHGNAWKTVREIAGHLRRGRDGDAGLADAAGTGEGQQTDVGSAEERGDG